MTECIDASRAAGPLHAAVVYDSDHTLLERAGPFVRAGLDRGEAIFAVVPPEVEQVLRSVLGTAARVRRTKSAARSWPTSTPRAGPPGC